MSTVAVPADALVGQPPAAGRTAAARARLGSIDALRGLVMLLMLVDHGREFFFIGPQVNDPAGLAAASPGLFFTRLAAHLCAPVFVALTGVAAWLYGRRRTRGEVSTFLLKRGLFLIVLELTVINFAWGFSLSPPTLFLQVIWAIGWSMVALAALVHLPRAGVIAVGAAIVCGHNLLDPIAFQPGTGMHAVWAVLHDRGYVDLWEGMRARTSYPVLPWIGVIALGYAIGPWFGAEVTPGTRRRALIAAGAGMLTAFVILRAVNGYGEPVAWTPQPTSLGTAMAFLNLTKYPPSLDFLLLTLGIGALLLAAWDRRSPGWLAVLGGAPLFFYILHLYALHLAHLGASAVAGWSVQLPSIGWVWLIAAAAAPPLWVATRWFAGMKQRRRSWWMSYL